MAKDTGVQGGFFDADFRLEEISTQGDPLEKLDQYIDWEVFRVELKRTVRPDEKDANKGGCPPL